MWTAPSLKGDGAFLIKNDMDYYRNVDHFPQHKDCDRPMGISYERVEDLDIEPVDVGFFRKHARIDFETEDKLIRTYIVAARQALEAWTQRSFGPQRWRFRALWAPDKWQLMYGPIEDYESSNYEIYNDFLMKGGDKIDVTYQTRGIVDDNIRIAICRYAAGLYAIRENIFIDDKGRPVVGKEYLDEAKEMVRPIRHISW